MEALQLIESGPEIDLVLADFAMPEMNRVELARAIKIKHPALPVILVTGYGNREFLNDRPKHESLEGPIRTMFAWKRSKEH